MAEHGVDDSVFSVQPPKDKTESAVQKEAAEQDQGCQLTEGHKGRGQVRCRKEECRKHVCDHKNTGGDSFPRGTLKEHLPKDKSKPRMRRFSYTFPSL